MNNQDFNEAIESAETPYGKISFFREDLYLGRSLREYGEWAKKELDFLSVLVRPGSVIIDAGAFIGTHTLAFSKFTGHKGKVYSFEAHPTFFKLLEKNIKDNSITNVSTFNSGLSNKTGKMKVEDVDIYSINSFGSMKLKEDKPGNNMLNIGITTVDSLNIESCDLIKLDVEGMEASVLSGASKLLEKQRPFVYAECNSTDAGWPVVQLMRNLDYQVYLYSEIAYNPDNYLKNSNNIFANARELSLLCAPKEKDKQFNKGLTSNQEIIPINNLDDLVLALIKKPQYKEEILEYTSGTRLWGNAFWCSESELEQIQAHLKNIEHTADQEKKEADVRFKNILESSHQEKKEADVRFKNILESSHQEKKEADVRFKNILESSQSHINSLRSELTCMKNSKSWMLTSPLRILRRKISNLLPPYPVGKKVYLCTRKIFRLLPIPQELKNKFRMWILIRWHFFSHQPSLPSVLPDAKIQDNKVITQWSEYQVFKNRLKEHFIQLQSLVSVKKKNLISLSGQKPEKVASSLQFKTITKPFVSIVLPVYGNISLTLECLTSIAKADVSVSYEIIVADDASKDETAEILQLIKGLRVLANKENMGFLRNCNLAFPKVQGEYVVILNNDAQVSDGWLDGLLDVFSKYPDTGAVGPKIIYPSGHLQEAGVSIKYDGSADMVGLHDEPSRTRYSYLRPVDYSSGVAIMLPTRLIGELGGFSEEFMPAYCEDADLCLRLSEHGYKTYYTPDVTIVHHLSSTMSSTSPDWKTRQITRNSNLFYRKWANKINALNSVRCIAFYLPQFHAIPENDEWWGKGFTEWTNVRKAQPNFMGHYQPREPGELGYYDLSNPEVMEHQAKLARRYGIDGFCFYYYWFGGKRLLENPIEKMLVNDTPPLPFCLCWANENWSRRWDGKYQEILIGQKHSPEDDIAVIRDLIRYFNSDQYIKIDDKPLLLVYRVDLFPDFYATSKRWRETCREENIGEIYLAMVESHDLVHTGTHPSKFGCDAAVEFPPLNMAETTAPSGELLNESFSGGIGDYRETAFKYCIRELPAYKRFRGVMPGWDNTARRQNNSFCFEHSSPDVFQAWIEHVLAQTRQQMHGDEQLIFINAWNEWAEGAYLEPDKKYGHAYLEAVKNSKEASRLLKDYSSEYIGPDKNDSIALIGHPYSPIGMGEHIRCSHRALRRASLYCKIVDIYQLDKPDQEFSAEFSSFIERKPEDINIFHINGDEVSQALNHLTHNKQWSGYNIIYPAWELSRYPKEWADQLDRFDEIWAPSKFIQDSLSKICEKTVIHMPLATEVKLVSFLPRKHFSIPESDYVFLFFFDVRSYVSRKNPNAVLTAFKQLLKQRPESKATLVLKILGSDLNPDVAVSIRQELNRAGASFDIIEQTLSDNEVKNLVRCCDCFISLHRSEGYGRGIAEAMALGKPVIATGYSGNMDFMSSDNAFCVDSKLISLVEGDYPHFEDQVWADPDIDQAVKYMIRLLDTPELGQELGCNAQININQNFGYRAVGNRMLERIETIRKIPSFANSLIKRKI